MTLRSRLRRFKYKLRAFLREPLITYLLITVNAVIFLLMTLAGGTNAGNVYDWGGVYFPAVVGSHQYWRLFTACFLHFGFEHLMGNMVALGLLGSKLEKQIGHIRFLLLYLLTGVLANIVSLGLTGHSMRKVLALLQSSGLSETLRTLFTLNYQTYYPVAAGASGCIMGIFGGILALYVFYPRILNGVRPVQILLGIAVMVYTGIADGEVDVTAHVAGLIFGFLLGILIALILKMKRRTSGGRS